MIINQNLSALNTFNALNKNTAATQKSIQRLSTGQRINSASDDAAGLAISEKMRGQISGLQQASSNAQDGISMLQTAEGGLDQTHSILQRMRELAVQSATDTNTADDRQKIQSETDQLAKEITRISNTTEFNNQNLLAGGLSDTFHIGANANQNISVSINAMDAQSLGVAGHVTTAASVASTAHLNVTNVTTGFAASVAGARYTVTATSVQAAITTATTKLITQSKSYAGSFTVSSVTQYTGTTDATYMVKIAGTNTTGSSVTSASYSKDNGVSWTTVTGSFTTASVAVDGIKFNFAGIAGSGASSQYTVGDEFTFGVSAAKSTLQLKDTAGVNIGSSVDVHKGDSSATVGDGISGQTVSLQFTYANIATGSTGFQVKQTNSVAAQSSSGVVLSQASTVSGLDVSTQSAANNAITTIDKAINTVSQQRSTLGAYENRLTNTIDNLNTSNENITASESRIRDVDMASEMSNYQKNNILQSAATSMLAKANTQPQSVLQLLQG